MKRAPFVTNIVVHVRLMYNRYYSSRHDNFAAYFFCVRACNVCTFDDECLFGSKLAEGFRNATENKSSIAGRSCADPSLEIMHCC